MALALVLAFILQSTARADAIKEAVQAIYEAGDYQQELPATYVPETGTNTPIDLPDLKLPASAMVLAFYAVMVAFAIFAVVILFMLLSGIRLPAFNSALRMETSGEVDEGTSSVPVTTEGWLSAADSLADQERFGEAVHALLLAVLIRLRERAAMAWRSSTTAREIVSRSNLTGDQESLLGLLVRSAELAHFGGRDAEHDEFVRCRDSALRLLDSVPEGRT